MTTGSTTSLTLFESSSSLSTLAPIESLPTMLAGLTVLLDFLITSSGTMRVSAIRRAGLAVFKDRLWLTSATVEILLAVRAVPEGRESFLLNFYVALRLNQWIRSRTLRITVLTLLELGRRLFLARN